MKCPSLIAAGFSRSAPPSVYPIRLASESLPFNLQ